MKVVHRCFGVGQSFAVFAAFVTLQEMASQNGAGWSFGDTSQLQVEKAPENDVGLLDLFSKGYAFLTVVIWALWILCTLLYYAAILLATEVVANHIRCLVSE